MPAIANYAHKYHDDHPGEPVKIGFMPSSSWYIFQFAQEYDFAYGEHFYYLSRNHGHTHKQLLSDIDVPCVYIHAKESVAADGTYMCAASREQAERAVSYIGDNCTLVETSDSEHGIHTVHMDDYNSAVKLLMK